MSLLVHCFQSSFHVNGPAFNASTTTEAAAGTRDLEVDMVGCCLQVYGSANDSEYHMANDNIDCSLLERWTFLLGSAVSRFLVCDRARPKSNTRAGVVECFKSFLVPSSQLNNNIDHNDAFAWT